MVKIAAFIALMTLASCAAVPTSTSPTQTSNELHDNRVSLYLGQRSLDEDDYAPVDKQATLGVEYARETAGSVIGWEVGLMASGDEDDVGGFNVKGSTGELYGGIHKSFGTGTVRPYVGAGLAYIGSKVEVSGVGDDDDSSAAGYAHAGVTFDLGPSFFLGLDARLLFGSDLEIAGVNTDADYGQLALVLGFAF